MGMDTRSVESSRDQGRVTGQRIRLINDDCVEAMRGMPADSIDSAVTDPPYGLGTPPDIAELLGRWLDGLEYEARGGGFMGKEWDACVPSPRIWRELFRVLKPGAHAVVFAGQRTADLMGISLRMSGFVVRDLGAWQYWQGFPKSHCISKAIDRKLGRLDERVVVGKKTSGIAVPGEGMRLSLIHISEPTRPY